MMKTLGGWILLTLALASGPTGFAQDSDSAREERFHQIYKKAIEAPTPEGAWSKALQTGQAQTYTIQQGDTLWNVSETLFGDPNFYPKVWALNGSSIVNPHEINPAHTIRFVEGTNTEPPTMDVKAQAEAEAEAKAEVTVTQKTDSAASDGQPENFSAIDLTLPPTSRTTKYSPLPKSLPDWDKANPTRYIYDFSRKRVPPPHAQVLLETFLHEGDVEHLGVVTEVENGEKVAGEEQLIYVRMESEPKQKKYLLVDESDTLPGLKHGVDAKKLTILAQVEILRPANRNEKLYLAKVLRVINVIHVGAYVTTGDIPVVSAAETTTFSNVAARVVGGEKDEARKSFGEHEIVFLNEGSTKGLAPGQMLTLYRRQILRAPNTQQIENYRAIGRAKILKTTSQFSTAVVTRSIEDIYVGDLTIAHDEDN